MVSLDPGCRIRIFAVLFFFSTVLVSRTVASAHGSSDPCPAVSEVMRKPCKVNCLIADPVCGEDGITYWCGCPEAACKGVRVSSRGHCVAGSSGAGLVPGQALLLVHIVWLFVLGFAVLFGFL